MATNSTLGLQKFYDQQRERLQSSTDSKSSTLSNEVDGYHKSQLTAVGEYESRLKQQDNDLTGMRELYSQYMSPDDMAGVYGIDATTSFDVSTDEARRNLSRYGLDPSSGAFGAMENNRAMGRAAIEAGAKTKGRWDSVKNGMALQSELQRLSSNIGSGYMNLASAWGDFAADSNYQSNLENGLFNQGGSGGGSRSSYSIGGASSRNTAKKSASRQRMASGQGRDGGSGNNNLSGGGITDAERDQGAKFFENSSGQQTQQSIQKQAPRTNLMPSSFGAGNSTGGDSFGGSFNDLSLGGK